MFAVNVRKKFAFCGNLYEFSSFILCKLGLLVIFLSLPKMILLIMHSITGWMVIKLTNESVIHQVFLACTMH